ncbi:MAG: hypothetical protein U1F35_07890 [Steroidobacteraceae bacterium]
MGPVLNQDLLPAVASAASHRPRSAVAERLRERAVELAKAEQLGGASFTYRICPLECIDGTVLVTGGERIEAPWLLPESGTLTALACGVCTLGGTLEARVRSLFAEGQRSLAVALDSLGNELLSEASTRMRHRLLKDLRRQGLSLSGELRSGDPGLAIDTQPLVIKLAGAQRIGVSLSHGSLLQPLKSTSGIFGVGIGLPKARWTRCDTCRSRDRCTHAASA